MNQAGAVIFVGLQKFLIADISPALDSLGCYWVQPSIRTGSTVQKHPKEMSPEQNLLCEGEKQVQTSEVF